VRLSSAAFVRWIDDSSMFNVFSYFLTSPLILAFSLPRRKEGEDNGHKWNVEFIKSKTRNSNS
jgi:hypothetical protein